MRNFIGIVGGFSVEQYLDGETPEILVESVQSKTEEQALLEDVGLQIRTTEDNEFDASWDGQLDESTATRLVQIISESKDYEVYYLNNMTFVFKNQAIAAARSLARHP